MVQFSYARSGHQRPSEHRCATVVRQVRVPGRYTSVVEHRQVRWHNSDLPDWSVATFDPSHIFGRVFRCNAPAGSFKIPAEVLMSLPDNPAVFGIGTGAIAVGGIKVRPFDADGTDMNMISYADQTTQTGTDFN